MEGFAHQDYVSGGYLIPEGNRKAGVAGDGKLCVHEK
jgi:hypothetical protein